MVIITSYPISANGKIVLVNSQTTSYPIRANGIIVLVNFAADFYFHNFTNLNYFPYDVKLRLLAHSQSFLANQKARNAIVGAENLLNCS